ncbi:MAG: ribosome silencing factor [Planctomycetota bacterium]
MDVSPRDMALHAARRMYDKGAEQLQVLHVPDENQLYDYVVIGAGRSERQTRTLVDEVYHFCKRHDIPHGPVEGAAGWYVIDCYNVVVHGFTPELLDYYELAKRWPQARPVQYEALWAAVPDPDRAV